MERRFRNKDRQHRLYVQKCRHGEREEPTIEAAYWGRRWWDCVQAPPTLVLVSQGRLKQPLQTGDCRGQQYPLHQGASPGGCD